MIKNPAQTVIEIFGGHKQVAEILNLDLSRVYRWTYGIDVGGTGGTIPQKHQIPLLKKAKELGLKLSPVDFFPKETPSTRAA